MNNWFTTLSVRLIMSIGCSLPHQLLLHHMCINMKVMFWITLLLGINGFGDRHIIAIYETENSTSPNCSKGSDFQCRINEIAHHVTIHSNTELRLCSHKIVLETIINISNVSNITVVGYDNPVINCVNGTSAGLNFMKIVNLDLQNFTIERCSFLINIDIELSNIKASVNIQDCTNVGVASITVTNGSGAGMTLIHNDGLVKLSDCTLKGNGQDKKSGGNGLYLETNANNSSTKMNCSNTEYVIYNCKFLHNMAKTRKYHSIRGFNRFNKGGGICIFMLGSSEIIVTIVHSLFRKNEAEKYGGGLFACFSRAAKNNIVVINNSNFSDNRGKYGGGTYAGYFHDQLDNALPPTNCSYIFKSNNYKGNHAIFGGGICLSSTKTPQRDKNARVLFDNCTMTNNTAQYGSAITILPNAKNLHTQGYLPMPIFKNSTFKSNFATKKKRLPYVNNYSSQYMRGAGVLYCFDHHITFRNENSFINNKGSALYLGFSVAVFDVDSTSYFSNNTAYFGGAIHLLSSVIHMYKNTRVNFTNNTAHGKGGAIYQYSPEIHSVEYSQTCFIEYIDSNSENRNVTFVFDNNTADADQKHNGHSIYTSSLMPCCKIFKSCDNITKHIFNTNVGNFIYIPQNRSQEIVTDINHTEFQNKEWSQVIPFIPGKETNITDYNLDDLNQIISTTYIVTVKGEIIHTTSEYSEISDKMLKLYGNTDETTKVTLSSTSSRKLAFSFKAHMQPCPPGFILHTRLKSCICSIDTKGNYRGIKKCNLTSLQAEKAKNYWFGYDKNKNESEDSLWSGNCPNNFCLSDKLLPSTANRTLLNKFVCSEHRTGILCGECEANYSVPYHTLEFDCKSNNYCHLGWLFFILSEIIPVTIIFLVIVTFNIPFTSGFANSFIFYAQVVMMVHATANEQKVFPNIVQTLLKIIKSIHLFFNLHVFVLDEMSYCIWKTANALDILSIGYIGMAYSFVLIVAVALVKDRCNSSCSKGSKKFNLQGNIIHGLSSFLILFFSHTVHSSIHLLAYSSLDNKGSQNRTRVVYYNGAMKWLSPHHLPYAIPAIITLTTVSIPPSLLIIYPTHYKILAALRVAEKRWVRILFNPLEKLKPFLDSFQSCFKDEFRFFSGFYFVYRVFLVMIMTLTNIEDVRFFIAVLLAIIMTIHSVLQPYKERLHNIIDILLLGNLTLINITTLYNFSKAEYQPSSSTVITSWIQVILLLLPLGCALMCILPSRKCSEKISTLFCKKNTTENESDYDELPDCMHYGTFRS